MDAFVVKLIISFVSAAIWVTVSTIVAEKLGSKIGGVILSIPSNLLIGLLFIGLTQSVAFASESTTVVPITMGFIVLFVTVYILTSHYNFIVSILGSLLVWFGLSFFLVLIRFDNFAISIFVYFLILFCCYFVIEKKVKVVSQGKKTTKPTVSLILFRSVLSGGIVAFAVLIAKLGGPLLGGIFAAFPGLTLAVIIIMHLTHGREFSTAVMKTFMISGPLNCVVYAVAVRYLYLHVGLFWGTISGLLLSILSSYIIYVALHKRSI